MSVEMNIYLEMFRKLENTNVHMYIGIKKQCYQYVEKM